MGRRTAMMKRAGWLVEMEAAKFGSVLCVRPVEPCRLLAAGVDR